jgi:hypothetical protein
MRAIIRDSREQIKDWNFGKATVIDRALKTGDFSLEGLEDKFTIERKKSTGEFAGNITQARFERELLRMDALEHSFIVCEFTMKQVLSFPFDSGIPRSKWRRIRISSGFLLKRIVEMQTKHKVKIIFAGENGEEMTKAIMREMMSIYGKNEADTNV